MIMTTTSAALDIMMIGGVLDKTTSEAQRVLAVVTVSSVGMIAAGGV